ncbi:MAG: class I SAM-dependent methyltransferase [Chitinophagaceae bacterium]|nr:class I SAM-dependent methyltransferase [Chitinophagaceae bacterium]
MSSPSTNNLNSSNISNPSNISRPHLFEFEDLPWFPQVIREGMMDFLRHNISWLNFYEPVAPLLKETLMATQKNELLELCAGGGGGVLKLMKYLNAIDCHPQITLSDLYPNIETYQKLKLETNGKIDFMEQPVDALNVPATVTGMRLLFSSFHHFRPESAKEILADAVNKKEAIGIFDAGNKGIFTMLFGVILLQPIAFLVLTPFFKPFRWSRLLFTYLLPLIPLCTIWDGCISILRFYTVEELKVLTEQISPNHYTWKVGQLKNRWGLKVNYLIGHP